MLLLGLLLICATGAFTGLLIANNLSGGPDYQVVLFGNTIATMNSLAIFLSGVALALIFCLGVAMVGAGGRMAGRRRALLRAARTPETREPTRPVATTTAPADPAATTMAPTTRTTAPAGTTTAADPAATTTAPAGTTTAPTATPAVEEDDTRVAAGTGRTHRPHRHLFGH